MHIRTFDKAPFDEIWQKMREFTDSRDKTTPDELWVVEHLPVYTLGQAGKKEHILNPGNIPVVQTDRGGQVTYHGPGQLVVYLLVDLQRNQMGIRKLVSVIEESVIACLNKHFDLKAAIQCGAPGVYIDGAKICSIGLRVRRGCSYHGLAFNINMDLAPFLGINPCGYQNLKITQLKDFGFELSVLEAAPLLLAELEKTIDWR